MKEKDKIYTGTLNQNSMSQWTVKSHEFKDSILVGNAGRISEKQKYQLESVRFTYDGHFAGLFKF